MAFLFVESPRQHNTTSVVQNAAKTLKVLLLAAGVISTTVMVKGALMSFSCEMVFSSVVGLWTSIRCIVSSPLYICFIINFMVLLIAASSTFHHHHPPPPPAAAETFLSTTEEKCSSATLYQGSDHDHHNPPIFHQQQSAGKARDGIKETAVDLSEKMTKEREAEEDNTMETTWKAINGDKRKQLKKSETFNEELATSASTWKDLRKSETFNQTVSIRRVGGLMRDPSVGIDEFNQQVEAFIKKFNQSMRLQRQESDQRILDMINRGL